MLFHNCVLNLHLKAIHSLDRNNKVPMNPCGDCCWIFGHTDKKKKVRAILINIPAMRTVANFTGRPSNRSLANASVVKASKAMIKALQVKYSGCSFMPIRVANGLLKKINILVNRAVLIIKDTRDVLNTSRSCSLSFENLK